MLPYYKGYSIWVCVIGVAIPVIVSTIYPLFTGQIMASTLSGLVLLFSLFTVSIAVGFFIFERKAQADTDRLLAYYNQDCDPEKLLDEGKKLFEAIPFPCNENGAWYLGYYAQAALDAGDIDTAKDIAKGLRESVTAAKKPWMKVGIMVNLIPLAQKLHGDNSAEELIESALSVGVEDTKPGSDARRDFLLSQKKLITTDQSGDYSAIAAQNKSIADNNVYPMRIRVESAYREASADYSLGEKANERSALEFVIHNGNKLALVAKAKELLTKLG